MSLAALNGHAYIEAELLEQMLRSGRKVHVVDVRAREDCMRDGFIDGSRRFPIAHLMGRFAELECVRSEPIVVVSTSGATARVAATAFATAGFPEVTVLRGGIARWLELGYPVVFGSGPASYARTA